MSLVLESESLPMAALDALPADAADRHVHDLAEFVRHARAAAVAQARGVRVAPLHRRPMVERLDLEAERHELLGDPQAQVWASWRDAFELAEQVAELDLDSDVGGTA